MLTDHLRHACRLARRNPLLTLGLVVILSGGMAVTTSVFGLVNVVWFRPSYPAADRLVVVHQLHPTRGYSPLVSPATYLAWGGGARSLDGVGAFEERSFSVGAAGAAAERTRGVRASAAVLELLSGRTMAGRAWLPEEETPGARPVAVVSRRFALLRFASPTDAVGRTLRLDGVETTIVGVWPAAFRLFNSGYDIFTPLPRPDASDQRPTLQVVARLAPGVAVERAAAELTSLAHAATARPADKGGPARAVPRPIDEIVWAGARPAYLLLLAAACLLLALVAANVTNLLMAHSARRQREFAIRLAMGAGRAGIVRQLVTEGGLLAIAAGVVALVFCSWLRSLLVASYPEMADLRLDPRVFAFTGATTLVAGLSFGLVPALSVLRQDARAGLSEAGRSAVRPRRRLGGALAVAQLGAAATLLVGCGLLLRSAIDLRRTDAGFPLDNLLTASVPLSGPNYATRESRLRFHHEAASRMARIPGVVSAAVSSALPLDGGVGPVSLEFGSRTVSGARSVQASRKAVGGGYFRTMGIPRLAGDFFDGAGEADPVAIVNETLARAVWGTGGAAVGSRIRLDGAEWRRVVGVVGDVRQAPSVPASPEIYVPLEQADAASSVLVLRTTAAPTSVAGALRRAVGEIDPDLAVADVWSMRDIVDSYVPAPFIAAFGLLAAIAMLLAALGLYALVSFQVTGRLREFAVRMALGADAGRVMRSVLADGLRLTATGLLAGLVGAAILGLALSRIVMGVRIVDPVVALAAGSALAAVSLAACLRPARRATRVETASALRCE